MNELNEETTLKNYFFNKAATIFFKLDQDGFVLGTNQYTKDIVGNDRFAS